MNFYIFKKKNTYINYTFIKKNYDTTYILIESMTLKCKRNRICWMERDEQKKTANSWTHKPSFPFSFCFFGFYFSCAPTADQSNAPSLSRFTKKNVSKIKTKWIKSIISCKMIGCFFIHLRIQVIRGSLPNWSRGL